METDRMFADVADATARREDGVARSLVAAVVQPRVKARREDVAARSPVAVVDLRRARKVPSRRRRRRTSKMRRNPVNPRRVAVTAEVVAALRQLAEAAGEIETARVLAAVVAAVALHQLAEAAGETETARVLAVVVAAMALRQLAEAARETEPALRQLAAVVAVVPTDREAAFEPGVRVVTAAALAHCAAEAPADAACRLTVEAANDAAGAGAPSVGEVGAEAAVLRG